MNEEDFLKNLANAAFKPFFLKSEHKRFLTQEEFEDDYAKITMLSHDYNKVLDFIKKQNISK